MVAKGLGPPAAETHAAENVACDVLGQDAVADVKEQGPQLVAGHSELQRIALGTLSISTSSRAAKKIAYAIGNQGYSSNRTARIDTVAAAERMSWR